MIYQYPWLLPWTLHKQRLMVVKLSINQHGIELRTYLRPFGILYAHYGIRVSCHLVSWNDISELGFPTIRHPRQQLSPFSWLCGRGWNAMAEVQLGVNQIMVQMHVINAYIMDEHNFLFFHHRFIYCIAWEHIIMHDILPSYMKNVCACFGVYLKGHPRFAFKFIMRCSKLRSLSCGIWTIASLFLVFSWDVVRWGSLDVFLFNVWWPLSSSLLLLIFF